MASARQIAANRKNTRKSIGPTSKAGRRRSAKNALRHGLASIGLPFSREIEELAHLLSAKANQENPAFASFEAAHADDTPASGKKAAAFDRFFKSDRTLDDTIRMRSEEDRMI
jgi:hypothetical protein